MTSQPDALRIRGLRKAFGPTQALAGVDVDVVRGTVHALLGGNGSGKSTLVKILSGIYQADGGTVELGGESIDAESYRAADGHRHGLRFVHQDLGLVESATVAENVAFTRGFPRSLGGRIAWSRLHATTASLLERYEIDVSPTSPVGALRPADRTMVAIARALGGDETEDAAILVLDEPTARLPRHESELLLRAVRRRAERGQTVVLISHHMGEVLPVADTMTVLRDGRTAGVLDGGTASEDDIIALIAGRDLSGRSAGTGSAPVGRQLALHVRGLAAGPLTDVDLDVRAGEIVGVIGLVGSGRTSLLRAVFGDLAIRSGSVEVSGRPVGGGVAGAMAAGVALVPEDRAADGAFPDHSLAENLSAAVPSRYWRRGVMRRGLEDREASLLIERFGIRAAGPRAPLLSLSGGNQQKALLARWLRRDPAVLLLDEPTQGVDVVSRAQIYATIRSAASAGCAVLVTSSESEELVALCDRAIVLTAGRVTAHVEHQDLTVDTLDRLTQTAIPAGAP